MVAEVDPGAHEPLGAEQPPALAQDRHEVRGRDVLERVRARDEVDRLGLEAGRAGVARGEIADPERLEVGGEAICVRDRVAHGTACLLLELAAEPAQPLEREVDELGPEVRPDVDERLALDPESPVGERDREVPAGSELVERRLAELPGRPVLLVRPQMAERARELAPEDALAGGQGARDAPLEHVVHALRMRKCADSLLKSCLRQPPHGVEPA